jgi:hypothetical protein
MEKLFEQLLKSAKTNKKGLKALKNAAVTLQNFEFAAKLREIEVTTFPETKEQKAAKALDRKLNLVLRMVDIKPNPGTAWLIGEALKTHNLRSGNFTIKDASRLLAKQKELFELND